MDSYNIDPVSFAESICARPKMWTATGRLEEVMALFYGYEIAICHSGTLLASKPTPSDALKWLAQKSCEEWHSLQARKLRSIYGSDEEILKELLKHLKKVRLEQDNFEE
jgi:hypothetical protein